MIGITTDSWLDEGGRFCSTEAEKDTEFDLFAAYARWFKEVVVFGMRSLFSGFVFGGASGSVVGQSINYVQTSVVS